MSSMFHFLQDQKKDEWKKQNISFQMTNINAKHMYNLCRQHKKHYHYAKHFVSGPLDVFYLFRLLSKKLFNFKSLRLSNYSFKLL